MVGKHSFVLHLYLCSRYECLSRYKLALVVPSSFSISLALSQLTCAHVQVTELSARAFLNAKSTYSIKLISVLSFLFSYSQSNHIASILY